MYTLYLIKNGKLNGEHIVKGLKTPSIGQKIEMVYEGPFKDSEKTTIVYEVTNVRPRIRVKHARDPSGKLEKEIVIAEFTEEKSLSVRIDDLKRKSP